MNRDNHDEMIEVGAFIDYQRGDIRRNMPPDVMLRNSEAVFEVDYVAACSLVARSHLINKTGLWQERLLSIGMIWNGAHGSMRTATRFWRRMPR